MNLNAVDVRQKFNDHLNELFMYLDPCKMGAEYKEAYLAGNREKMVTLIASYFRKKEAQVHLFSGSDRFDKEVADNAAAGKMREVNVDWEFPDGEIEFLFDPTAVKGPENHEWVWQFNRHSYWSTMANAYFNTKDEKYAKAFCHQLLLWIAQVDLHDNWNGAGSGWRTIECGLRLLGSWQVAFNLFRESPSFTDEAVCLMIASMHRQARHLTAHFTRRNWLMMEADGAYTFASLFPEFRDAEEIRVVSGTRLCEEFSVQLLPDGLQEELSPDYHSVVFSCALKLYSIAKELGRENELPPDYGKNLYRAAMAYVNMSTPAFTQPRTNDCFTMHTDWVVGSARAVFPDEPAFTFVSSNRKEGAPSEGVTPSKFFPYAGFAVMRGDWTENSPYLCFDVGPLGTAHVHQDKLNINLWLGTRELIFDDGGGQYEISPARTYGLSAFDHNTVLVDGMAQNRDNPGKVSEPIDAGWKTSDKFDYAFGIYDGPFGPDKKNPAIHKREVRFIRPGFFAVSDTMTSLDNENHRYDFLLHFDTLNMKKIESLGNGAVLSQFGGEDGREVLVLPLGGENETTVFESAQTEPVYSGWYVGRNEAVLHPATTVRRFASGTPDRTFKTLLFPMEKGDGLPEVTYSGNTASILWRGNRYTVDFDNLAD